MAISKVLVVDDSPTDLNNIKNIVSDAGYMVVTAQNGKEALDLARSQQPDLIFLDIIMPDMDGYAACRELTNDSETKNIPVVFVTSKNQKADRVWAQMQGGKAYVAKPYTSDDILNQINTFN